MIETVHSLLGYLVSTFGQLGGAIVAIVLLSLVLSFTIGLIGLLIQSFIAWRMFK